MISISACSSDDGEEELPESDAAVRADGAAGQDASGRGATTPDAGAPVLPPEPPPIETSFTVAQKLAGSYVGKITMRKIESVGALGSMNALVTLLGNFTIKADAASQQVMLESRYCHVELSGEGTGLLMGSGVVTPDIVMTSTVLEPVALSANTGADGKVVWSTPEVHGAVGWTWDTAADALPRTSSDTRVRDQDGDQNPGVTTMVTISGSGTPVYVVQTLRDTFRGTVEADGTLVGTVVDRTEQNVLGSPNPLLSVASLMEQPDTNTADNIVRFRKVDALPECAELVTKATTFFP